MRLVEIARVNVVVRVVRVEVTWVVAIVNMSLDGKVVCVALVYPAADVCLLCVNRVQELKIKRYCIDGVVSIRS